MSAAVDLAHRAHAGNAVAEPAKEQAGTEAGGARGGAHLRFTTKPVAVVPAGDAGLQLRI